MNLENVKYPWLLAKMKNGGWEIELRNFEKVPDSQLEQIYHNSIKEKHRTRVQLIRERGRAKLAEEAEEMAGK